MHGEHALAPAVMEVLDTVCDALTVIVHVGAVHVAPAVMLVPGTTPEPTRVMPTARGPDATADTVKVVPVMEPVKEAA